MSKAANENQPEYTNDKFFKAFAIAMLQWQHVEHNLYTLFHALSRPTHIGVSGAIFYAQDSFGPKLNLVDKTAQVAIQDEELKEWESLKKRLKEASKDRNVLAHLTVNGDFRENDELQLVMAPPLFVPHQLVRKRAKKYDLEELERIADVFYVLGIDLSNFAQVIGTKP